MPPFMSKLTSVRDRVAAIERAAPTENTVIRARIVPDVKGVNRYKHFHKANAVEASRSFMGHIDKNTSGELPTLIQPGRLRQIQPHVDDGYENNGVEKAHRKSPRRVNLPQLHSSPRGEKKTERDIVDYIEHQARHAMHISTDSETSNKSARQCHSAVRLHDHLSSTAIKLQQPVPGKRTFAQLGARQNGIIINRPNDTLDVAMPPRSKSAHDVSESTSEETTLTVEIPEGSQSSREKRKDTATQTTKNKKSTTSVEFLDPNAKGRIKQTESIPIVIVPRRASEVPRRMADVEEREALFNVIDEALGETIDRYSRERTNQIIANSARKQARIWRDAKEFIACQLLPQSIILANQSKTAKKTAAEIVASIKCYP